MPLSSNPNATTTFWLPVDEETPLDKRPVFLVRFLTELECQRHSELMDAARIEPDPVKAYKSVSDAVLIGITDWKNFTDAEGKDIPWDATDPLGCFKRARIIEREMWYVAHYYPQAVRLAGHDLPLSGSRASSNTARNADDTVPAETAPAPVAA